MNDLLHLRLDGLHERHPGLTQALGQSYAEAASVCLSRHHQPPVILSLKHAGNDQLRVVNFVVPDARVSNAHANEIDATETGAYGVSLAAVETVLDDKLPETYDRALFTEKCNSVFETMLNYASQGVKWAVAA